MSLRIGSLLLALSVLVSGCGLAGPRRTIAAGEARAVLEQAVSLVSAGEASRVCDLSPSAATTCPDTFENASGVIPESEPTVVCAIEMPDHGPLRRGIVLVVEGVDGINDPYRTEFIVFDDGDAVGVLDAVFWSGLSVQSYNSDTVTWRFDSASDACERGGLPAGDAPLSGGASTTPVPLDEAEPSDTTADS